jgi:hypothetical protein
MTRHEYRKGSWVYVAKSASRKPLIGHVGRLVDWDAQVAVVDLGAHRVGPPGTTEVLVKGWPASAAAVWWVDVRPATQLEVASFVVEAVKLEPLSPVFALAE